MLSKMMKKNNNEDHFEEINLNDTNDDDRNYLMSVHSSNLGFVSDIGRRKKENQDYAKVGEREDGVKILVLADGVTTSPYSGEAAEFACNYLFEKLKSKGSYNRKYIKESIRDLNKALVKMQDKVKIKESYRSTLIVAMVNKNEFLLSWLGDSRGYIVNENMGFLLSEDDSFVNKLVRKGEITKAEAATHPDKNKITQCLGLRENIKNKLHINMEVFKLPPNNSLLLCSDGLWGDVDLTKGISNSKTIDMTLINLIHKANRNGGGDNITCAIYKNE